MEPKPWYTSITLWANAIIMAIAILSALLDPDIAKLLTPEAAAVIAAVISILNILLRLVSGQPVTQAGAARVRRSTIRKQ